MKTISRILAVLIAIVLVTNVSAQDVRFTQLLNHPMQLNPALISSSNDFRATIGHRAQWQDIDKGYVTESISLIQPVFIKKDAWKENRGNARLDIGLSVINERAGAFNTINPMLAVSSGLRITRDQFVSVSVYGGYFHKMLDVSNLTFDEQYMYGSWFINGATGESLINESAGAPDVGFGMAWYYVPMNSDAKINAYAGVSGFHLNEFNSTFLDRTGKIHSKVSFQGGLRIIPDDWMDIEVHAGYTTQAGINQLYTMALAGFHVEKEGKIVLGSLFKERESIGIQLGYHHLSYILDLSYDFPYGDITKALNNLSTWEVAVGYRFNRAKSREYVNNTFF